VANGFPVIPPKGPALGWIAAVQTDARSEPRPNLYNVMLALRDDVRFCDLLAYDEMLRVPVLIQPLPARLITLSAVLIQGGTPVMGVPGFKIRPVADVDVTALQELLQDAGLEKIGKEVVHQAVDLRASERPFHPVRNYLDGLKWDGQPRLTMWLSLYMGAQDNEYHKAIGPMFLVSMVARVYEPGCQVDYMPVLEGPQGELKSSALRALAGDEYFSDELPSLHGDQVRLSQHLRGKWLIEIAEMAAMSKAESDDLKAFITRRTEQYIPKYGRKEVFEPRQSVFAGTTNNDTYLRDETGGRRFWPIKTGVIDLAGLVRDRDQLFAEAVCLRKTGYRWWPDRNFERMHIAPVQASRLETDAWEEPISKFLTGQQNTHCILSSPRVTTLQVAQEALGITTERLGKREQMRIAAIMRQRGWQRNRSNGVTWWEP
jgi:predicted P-loop ATPase